MSPIENAGVVRLQPLGKSSIYTKIQDQVVAAITLIKKETHSTFHCLQSVFLNAQAQENDSTRFLKK